MQSDARTASVNVVIAGGGVAALETLLALHELAGDRVSTTLVAPEYDFTYRPMTTAEPFALGHAERYPLQRVADDFGARLVRDSVQEVVPDQRRVRCTSGAELDYDVLVVAVGARTVRAFPHGITFGEPGARDALQGALADLEGGYLKRVAFVVPPGTSWSLPLYELALMTAAEVHGMGIDDAELSLVSTEPSPLAMFGDAASAEVGALLAEVRIEFVGDSYANVEGQGLTLMPGNRVLDAERVISLPMLLGPGVTGLPSDADGFIGVDDHGWVEGVEDVYAAGDATTFPIKQGGLAAQQADAVAQAVAARAGAPVEPAPFRPVLRGVLLTGGAKRYLRRALAGGGSTGDAAGHTLWWPPHKIAGRYLSPYLFGREEEEILHLHEGMSVTVAS